MLKIVLIVIITQCIECVLLSQDKQEYQNWKSSNQKSLEVDPKLEDYRFFFSLFKAHLSPLSPA